MTTKTTTFSSTDEIVLRSNSVNTSVCARYHRQSHFFSSIVVVVVVVVVVLCTFEEDEFGKKVDKFL